MGMRAPPPPRLGVTWWNWGSLGRGRGAGTLSCWPALGSSPACQGEDRVTNRGDSQGGEPPQPLWVLGVGTKWLSGSAYRGSNLGTLCSDQGLQAAATAGFALPRAGVFKLAGSVNTANLDALLGATWEEMLTGPAACPGGPAQRHAGPGQRPAGGREAGRSAAGCSLSPTCPSREGSLLGTVLCVPQIHVLGMWVWDLI